MDKYAESQSSSLSEYSGKITFFSQFIMNILYYAVDSNASLTFTVLNKLDVLACLQVWSA